MPINYSRFELRQVLDAWTLVRDCIAGQKTIKSKGDVYLPRPNSEDTSQENKKRYEAYIGRAVFYNVTKRTLDGLVGQVFTRDPIVRLPKSMVLLETDIDGSGVRLEQQSKRGIYSTLSFGRAGLLADYPPVADVTTAEERDLGFVRPIVCFYEPWDIINWRTIVVGGRKLLSLVVLNEPYITDDDGYELTLNYQYRILKLNYSFIGDPSLKVIDPKSLSYHVEIYRDIATDKNIVNFAPIQSYTPRDANGNNLKEIPFVFIGAVNNDSDIDPAPIYDLAVLNIAHYRNSADYEESCFLTGQPTPYFAGLTEYWVKNVMKNTVYLGSRGAVMLPQGGVAGLLQAKENTMPFEAMTHKERQMVALGAKLIEQRRVERTLGETQIETTGESSILSTVAKNVGAAYTNALKWCANFMGITIDEEEDTLLFELNTDFPAARMTSVDRAQLMAEWQGSAISYTEMRAQLRKAGVASQDDDVSKKEVKENPPPVLVKAPQQDNKTKMNGPGPVAQEP